MIYLLVAIGSAIGGVARYGLGALMLAATGPGFPWGTLLINILGSLVIGAFAAATAPAGRYPGSPEWRSFVMVGLCGGFTTFSAFSLQTLELLQLGETARAFTYIALSVSLCVGGAWFGAVLARG